MRPQLLEAPGLGRQRAIRRRAGGYGTVETPTVVALLAKYHHFGERQIVGVGDRQQGFLAADGREPAGGAAVQRELRRAAAAHDFDVAPQNAARVAGAERFHRCFLRGEAAGKMDGRNAATEAVIEFAGREDALQKAVAVPVDRIGNPVDIGGVQAQTDDVCHDSPLLMKLPPPQDAFRWIETDDGPALICTALEPHAIHLFTTRPWALGSAAPGDLDAWDAVAHAVGVGRATLVRLHQVHGASVVFRRIGELRDVNHLPDADIVASNDPSLALAIQTADCVPILIADRRTGVVTAAHAGWRGLAARVPSEAVQALGHRFDSAPADLVAALGPSISAPRYEVGADVRQKFEDADFSAAQLARWFSRSTRADHWQFDGARSAADQLETAGVPRGQIFACGLCTATYSELLCSYRRDWKDAGRMAAVIRARGTR